MKVKLLSRVRLFATPWTVTHRAPKSMGFSRQEYWSGLPFPSPGDLPDPGTEPGSPALWTDDLHLSHQGSPQRIKIEIERVSNNANKLRVRKREKLSISWSLGPIKWQDSKQNSYASQVVQLVKKLPANLRRHEFHPWVGKMEKEMSTQSSFCLEISVERGTGQATVHRVAQSHTAW